MINFFVNSKIIVNLNNDTHLKEEKIFVTFWKIKSYNIF